MRTVILGLALSTCLAACTSKDNGHAKAMGVSEGTAEAEVVRIAGSPTRTQPATGECAKAGGQRELIYEQVVESLWGLLADETIGLVSLCVNKSGVVLSNMMVDF
jgi:hypothetical protein